MASTTQNIGLKTYDISTDNAADFITGTSQNMAAIDKAISDKVKLNGESLSNVNFIESNGRVEIISSGLEEYKLGGESDKLISKEPLTIDVLKSANIPQFSYSEQAMIDLSENEVTSICAKFIGSDNLFNKLQYVNKNLYATTSSAYINMPIYLKPNTKYVVKKFIKPEYKDTVLPSSINLFINQYYNSYVSVPTAIRLLTRSEEYKVLTTDSYGCLYIMGVYFTQENLDMLNMCMDILITEYKQDMDIDVLSFAEYIGKEMILSNTVTELYLPSAYMEIILNPEFTIPQTVSNVSGVLTLNKLNLKNYASTVEVEEMNSKLNKLSITSNNMLSDISDLKTNKCSIPLYVETASNFYFVDGANTNIPFIANGAAYTEDGSKGNGYFKISGTQGQSVVSVVDGGNATLTDIDGITYWGAVIGYDDGTYKPCLVLSSDATQNTLTIYPPLEKDITNGELGNMAVDGMHLSRRGYRSYIQHIYNMNPKHCEKEVYLDKFIPDKVSPIYKFSTMGTLSQYITEKNATSKYRGYPARIFYQSVSYSDVTTTTGLEWEMNVMGYNGYFETSLSGGQQDSIYKDEGYEMYIEWYVDGALKEQIIKRTNELQWFCFDFKASDTICKIKVYYNKMRANTDKFVVGQSTWWVNKYTHADKLIPRFSSVAQLFDSWGEFHGGESGKEMKRLISKDAGVTVPYENHSKGGQTSAWGKAWWYDNVKQYNPTHMITDFGINDCNSTSYSLPETVAGPDGKTYKNRINVDEYKSNLNDIFNMCLTHNIQPIMCLGCMGNAYLMDWMNKLTIGKPIKE